MRDRAHARVNVGAARLWEMLKHERPVRGRARRADGEPGHADGAGGLEGDLPERMAGRRRTRTLSGHMYPDQSLYPVNSVPAVVPAPSTTRCRRADQIECDGGDATARLVRAHRGRRRGGLRRAPQRVRADEGHDRRRRRGRRALRGPAFVQSRRSAATSAARCSSRPATSSAAWWRRDWPPT